MPSFSIIQFKK
jgi:hypothetical protein